ncbi:response regulator aspartate phosphatase RapG [Bacillus inaquosorum]|uniref:Response regulator aspartate phosphatase RapG n=1 Tax=Bacillus inaquosorum TaxID=483913 RepID=A0A9Q4ETL7_9BACI|nr:response regulator aspartate phosphatase RapG [Bacillus inaquosorum]MCY7758522.1 response regulator aspartate phosphatase RapG [Bacillus inaquosorum]MCY8083620.1 response regulator aspartate phosphatase RapG [Bacillus inaquosorum]MCY8169716.1 response regulator aspartate phosphatase RapG [Bacillus inaquosorum]MCY8358377.1 response regulator aspartate phosphatase RapG [Bacillus inaquosorum]MCY8701734.1 response regulator aspartate phosphatase RapG [Bacillus inaquosorum]
MNKIAPAEIASMLNDWYLAIKKHEVEESSRLFEEVKPLLDDMEEDQEVLAYFSLLELRHKVLLHEARGQGFQHEEPSHMNATSDMLKYYFFLFEGMYEAYKNNYDIAIGLYKDAEQYLDNIPDPIEKAEFHLKVGKLYYKLGQNIVSLNHTRQAVKTFREETDYKKKLASALITMSGNFTEMSQFEEAETYLDEAIRMTRELEDHFFEAQLLHNFGLLHAQSGKSEEAVSKLEEALQNEEYARSAYYYHSVYLLIRELFKIKKYEQAVSYYQEAKEKLTVEPNRICEAKIDILYAIYAKGGHAETFHLCKQHMDDLVSEKEYDSVRELSILAGERYREHELYKEAAHFFYEALQIEELIKRTEVI